MTVRISAALLAASALSIAGPAPAQSDAQTIAELKAQVDALTKRVSELERGRATAPTPAPASGVPTAASASATPPATQHTLAEVKPVPPEVPAGPIDRPMQPFGSALQVSASSDSSEVALRLGTSIARADLGSSGIGRGIEDSISLTASAPLDKKNTRTDLGTLDSFANSSVLKLRWTRFVMPIRDPDADPRLQAIEAKIEENARNACRAKAGANEEVLKACNEDDIDINFVRKWSRKEAGAYRSLYFGPAPSFAFGLEGSVGYRKFTYFDATSLAEQSSKKVPLGATGFFTLFPNPTLTSITGSLEYQHVYEDQKAAILCPVSATGPVRCINGPIGTPNRKDSLLGALEYRRQFLLEDFWIPSIGIAPQVTYDFLHRKGGVDLPIYLVPDAKGNLLGGVRFGYRTDTDDLAVGVFVGTAFSFQP